ncbi:hypothetical protein EZV62_006882 [Acer yangbiense]|uniref:Uncharacterized protein n=1 Tax=Acer yangbiense TaxID=1000413 RepID=A0A5C7I8W0_9ROSI|nr:hypothetical protein EZV62_006882 [Acer yangbiense]
MESHLPKFSQQGKSFTQTYQKCKMGFRGCCLRLHARAELLCSLSKVYESKPADLIQGELDTFHEPFKRAVSSHPPIPETEATGVEKDTQDTSKITRKKESELTVKSALSAPFAE